MRARQSYFLPLSPMSLANSATRASCYLGFFQGTRLQRHPLKVSPSDSQHFKDPSMVAGLFALPGWTMQLQGPRIRIPGNCSPGLHSPHTLLSELSVCGTDRGGMYTHACAGSVRGIPDMAACMCALALLDVTECALGLIGVCLCACVCRSVPPDPTSVHLCGWNISGHKSMCVHFRGGAYTCPCPHAHPGARR